MIHSDSQYDVENWNSPSVINGELEEYLNVKYAQGSRFVQALPSPTHSGRIILIFERVKNDGSTV